MSSPDTEPNTYGPGNLIGFAAHAALADPENVQFIPESEAEERAFRREQRRLLARYPEVRQLVASRVAASAPPAQGHERREGHNKRQRGSRRSRAGPDDSDPEPVGNRPRPCWQTVGVS